MDNDSMGDTDESEDSNGNGDSPHEHQEKSRLLSDSLYDGPLDHIIRNHPKLFVRPRYWTKRHVRFLHVVCKEERSWVWSTDQHCQRIKQQEHEGLIRHVGKSVSESQESDEMQQDATLPTNVDTDLLRVPSFRFPSLPHPHLNSHIGRLRTENAFISHTPRRIAMESLLVWKRPRPSNIWRTLLNPDHVPPEPIKTKSYKSDDNIKDLHHRLKVESIPLFIGYGKRRIGFGLSPQTYTVAGDAYTQRNAWRLIYLDRSQLGNSRLLSKRERRRQRMAVRLGIDVEIGPDPSTVTSSDDNEDERDGWPVNQGYMTSLFIAMAQQRQCEIEYEEEQKTQPSTADTQQEAPHAPSHSTPQVHPRYQILLTDNDEDSSCIHLYTAHVSDFLLEHFRTPSRSPLIAPSEHEPHLLKIHHTMIPFAPYKSFRRRLRMTIMEYANGTAGGFFFSDLNPARDGEQERSSKCVATTVETNESADLEHREEQVDTQACVVV
ncbi:hypothetical protein F5B21DRAFT_459812 [Xylaria acuta]|nr:hypothetical protein F5B21DRAFT_459812 [Xylaria acuta]